MKISFLFTKSWSLPAIAKGDNADAKNSPLEVGCCLYVFNCQHQGVNSIYLHVEYY